MKTALFHSCLTSVCGSERMILCEIGRLYPDCDIFTHAALPQSLDPILRSHTVRETFIARLPGGRMHCQRYLPLMPAALRSLDLRDYDLIISSGTGPVKGIRKAPGAIHVCFCHTPLRALRDMNENDDAASSGAGTLFRALLRYYDVRCAKSVDCFLASSHFTAERIRRLYGCEAKVIHPPVRVEFFAGAPAVKKQDFYLAAGELVPGGRTELAIEACVRLRRTLLVAGAGSCFESLRRKYRDNSHICFVGHVSDEELRALYSSARALLFPGAGDFSAIPVEAMAAGTPVIAFHAGGAPEAVREGKSGLFFREPTASSLMDSITEFEKRSWPSAQVRHGIGYFSADRFRREFQEAVSAALASAR